MEGKSTAVSLPTVQRAIGEVKDKFMGMVVRHDPAVWEAEAMWAMQALGANDYLMGIAAAHPESLKDAVTNVAATGLSLNPVRKLAYLVPRDKKVTLEISYRGLIQAAIDSGRIKAVQAVDLVYSNDAWEYEQSDEGTKFRHQRPRLGTPRGDFEGAYCVTILNDDNRLVTVMTKDEIDKIKTKALRNTKDTGPWKSDEDEMRKKTVVRRAAKYWPLGASTRDTLSVAQKLEADPAMDPEGAIEATATEVGPEEPVDPNSVPFDAGEPENPVTLISEEQKETIEAACKGAGLELKRVLGAFRIHSLDDLELERYEQVLARIADFRENLKKSRARQQS